MVNGGEVADRRWFNSMKKRRSMATHLQGYFCWVFFKKIPQTKIRCGACVSEWIFCFQKIHVKESWRQALIIFNYQMMMSLCVWFHEGIVWLHVSQSWSHSLPFSGNKSTNLPRQLWPQLRKNNGLLMACPNGSHTFTGTTIWLLLANIANWLTSFKPSCTP